MTPQEEYPTHLKLSQFTLNAMLYVVTKLNGMGLKSDQHKVMKILYFAELKHLNRYKQPFIEDVFIKMPMGPVLSNLRDALKEVQDNSFLAPFSNYRHYFSMSGSETIINAKREPDLDMLSVSEIECLDDAISENGNLSFGALTNKSHDSAWENSADNRPIDCIEIAKSSGLTGQALKTATFNISNSQFLGK